MTDSTPSKLTCAICLDPICYRGSLSVCQHSFCFDCILEWSKVDNSCPLCKSKFRCIRKQGLFAGASPMSRVRVADKQQRVWYDDDDIVAEDVEGDSLNIDPQATHEFGGWLTSRQPVNGYDLTDSFIDDSDATQSAALWTLLAEPDLDYDDWRSDERSQRRPRRQRQTTVESYALRMQRQVEYDSDSQRQTEPNSNREHQETQPVSFFGQSGVSEGERAAERIQTRSSMRKTTHHSSLARRREPMIVSSQSLGGKRKRKRKAPVRRGVKPTVAKYFDELSGSGTELKNSGSSSYMADDGGGKNHKLIGSSALRRNCYSDLDESDSDFEPLSVRVKKKPPLVSAVSEHKKEQSQPPEASSRHASTIHAHLLKEQVSNSSSRSTASAHHRTKPNQQRSHAGLLEALQATSPPSASHSTLPSWLAASNPFLITQRQGQSDNTPFDWTPITASRKRKVFFGSKTNIPHSEVWQPSNPDKTVISFHANNARSSMTLKHEHVLVIDTDEESD